MTWIWREIVEAVDTCPINKLITVENCSKCTYAGKWRKPNKIACGLKSETEKNMKAEPSKQEEYKNRW